MAFDAGLVSYQRFHIDGRFAQEIDDGFLKRLNGSAFGKIAAQRDGTHAGWVGPRHLFDLPLRVEDVAFGRFAHFSLRVEVSQPPPALVRSYVRMEEDAAREASGREQLSRGERKACVERARLRADQEARSGQFRKTSATPVLIDLEQSIVYFAQLAAKPAELLMALFHAAFDVSLEPISPQRLAERLLKANPRVLENLSAVHPAVPPGGSEPVEHWKRGCEFLGREWITWLWQACDEGDGVALDDARWTLALERSIDLTCPFQMTGKTSVRCEQPATAPEARAALRLGKLPTRMGLLLGGPLGEFRLTLNGETLGVSGLALPEPEAVEDPLARVESRFEALADFSAVLDALYELFLKVRTGREAAAWERNLRAWASGGQRRMTASA